MRRFRRPESRGQALVEFALVVPIFLFILIAIVEFTFIFNAILATNFASRDGALAAAEGGDQAGADCVILQAVDADMGAPTIPSQIQRVEIFRANSSGVQTGNATIYTHTGSFDCGMPDGTTINLPYTLTQDGYPEANRCNILAGCGSQSLDLIGVRVAYRHNWRTPFGQTFGPYLDVIRSNTMRMEPVL